MSCHVSTRLVHQHSHRYPMDCLTSTCVSGVATGVLARGTLLSWMFAVSLRWALAVNAKKCVTTLFNLSCQVLSTFDPRADLAMSSLLSEHASLPLDMPFLPCYPIAVPHNTSPASKRSRRQKLWDHASDVTRHRQQPETCEHAHAQKLPMWSRWHGHCWSTQILCGSWTKFVCAVGHEKKWDSDSWQGRTDAYNWDDRAHLRAAAPSLNAWDLEWSLRATLTLKESMLFGNCALLDARVCKYRSEVWSEPRALLETTALDSVHDRFLCELQIFSRIVHRFVVKGFLVFSHNVELSELRQSFRNSTPLRHQVRPLHENFQHYWRSMPWLRCLVGTSVNSRLCRPWWIYLQLIVQKKKKPSAGRPLNHRSWTCSCQLPSSSVSTVCTQLRWTCLPPWTSHLWNRFEASPSTNLHCRRCSIIDSIICNKVQRQNPIFIGDHDALDWLISDGSHWLILEAYNRSGFSLRGLVFKMEGALFAVCWCPPATKNSLTRAVMRRPPKRNPIFSRTSSTEFCRCCSSPCFS